MAPAVGSIAPTFPEQSKWFFFGVFGVFGGSGFRFSFASLAFFARGKFLGFAPPDLAAFEAVNEVGAGAGAGLGFQEPAAADLIANPEDIDAFEQADAVADEQAG